RFGDSYRSRQFSAKRPEIAVRLAAPVLTLLLDLCLIQFLWLHLPALIPRHRRIFYTQTKPVSVIVPTYLCAVKFMRQRLPPALSFPQGRSAPRSSSQCRFHPFCS